MYTIAFFGSVYSGHNIAPSDLISTLADNDCSVHYFSVPIYSSLIQERVYVRFIPYPAFDKLTFLTEAKLPTEDDVNSRLLFLTEVTVDAAWQLMPWIETYFAENKLKVDLVIYDNMALWGYIVAERLGINNICLLTLSKIVSEPLSLLHDQGVSGMKDFIDIMTCGYNPNTILYTSPFFQHPSDFFLLEYMFFPPKCSTSIDKRLFNQSDISIYISFGTVYNNDIELYRDVMDVLYRHADYKIIVSTGGNDDTFNALQPYAVFAHIEILKFLNQTHILSTTDIFITHAGMNSAKEAICGLVPMIAIPLVEDQNNVAASLARLGAAKMISRDSIREELSDAVEAITMDHAMFIDNIQKIRESFLDHELLEATLHRIHELAADHDEL